MIPSIIPASNITKNQLEELNAQYNGNLKSLTDIELSIWKYHLIKNGYIWNDLDGWGYWSISNIKRRKIRLPSLSFMLAKNDNNEHENSL